MSRPRPLRFPFYCSRPPRDLHSFPTRRSSDLQYSFSTDPKLRGAPAHHVVNIREVRLAAGAEFVIMICGDIIDRKSTRLNSSHMSISYAVFCLKKKKREHCARLYANVDDG